MKASETPKLTGIRSRKRYIPCGPSMTDCPETSRNLQKPLEIVRGGSRQVSGKFAKSLVTPALFELNMVKCTIGLELPINLSIYRKPARNLSETSTAGFGRFPENPSLTNHNMVCMLLLGGASFNSPENQSHILKISS